MFWNSGWHTGGAMVWWVIFIFAVVAVSWFLASRTAPPGVKRRRVKKGGEAEEILKRRYARGEIDRETYDRMLTDLRK